MGTNKTMYTALYHVQNADLSDGRAERRIDELASAEGVSMAEIIRRALDDYLNDQPDPSAALASTFGAAPDFEVPSRDEWDRG